MRARTRDTRAARPSTAYVLSAYVGKYAARRVRRRPGVTVREGDGREEREKEREREGEGVD